MNRPTPQFITFEGTEGVGKTTAIERFCHALDERGIAYIRTREPGGSALAEHLRKILLDNKTQIHDDTELLLMFTARSDHLHRTILPALDDGKWVVCDRFFDSTVAYQGFGRYFGKADELAKIDLLIKHFITRTPDMTFWLDLDPAIGLYRAGKRSTPDRFESQGDDFFGRVYQGFLSQHRQHPERICRIDAQRTPDEVLTQILGFLDNKDDRT